MCECLNVHEILPSIPVVGQSLLIQNSLVALSAAALAVMFGRDLGICGDVSLPLFIVLSAMVIILASLANLATVANTIAKEKDWIVVIADKNEHTLAGIAQLEHISPIATLPPSLPPSLCSAKCQHAPH